MKAIEWKEVIHMLGQLSAPEKQELITFLRRLRDSECSSPPLPSCHQKEK